MPPPFDPLPPPSWDRLRTLSAQVAGAMRSADRCGYEGALDPAWAERIARKLAAALRECERARAAGAVLPVRPPAPGADVEVLGPGAPKPLPTEAERAAADWAGLR